MAKVEGVGKLLTQLNQRAAATRKDGGSAVVGFSAGYSLIVHEDLEATHTNGSAKFLEQPYRELAPQLAGRIAAHMKQGKTLREAILLEALGLQRAAQLLCPVDTGNMKASAFTRWEDA